jgi:hypothetical protein
VFFFLVVSLWLVVLQRKKHYKPLHVLLDSSNHFPYSNAFYTRDLLSLVQFPSFADPSSAPLVLKQTTDIDKWRHLSLDYHALFVLVTDRKPREDRENSNNCIAWVQALSCNNK